MIWKGYAGAQPSPQAWKDLIWWCILAPPNLLGLSVLSQMQLSHIAAHRVVLVNPLPLGTRLQGMALQREILLSLTAKASDNV